jgi:hypothetical protein
MDGAGDEGISRRRRRSVPAFEPEDGDKLKTEDDFFFLYEDGGFILIDVV